MAGRATPRRSRRDTARQPLAMLLAPCSVLTELLSTTCQVADPAVSPSIRGVVDVLLDHDVSMWTGRHVGLVMSAVSDLIALVLGRRSPPEIVDMVVPYVTIQMPGFHAHWT